MSKPTAAPFNCVRCGRECRNNHFWFKDEGIVCPSCTACPFCGGEIPKGNDEVRCRKWAVKRARAESRRQGTRHMREVFSNYADRIKQEARDAE